jgi:hypothetical protein
MVAGEEFRQFVSDAAGSAGDEDRGHGLLSPSTEAGEKTS